ncbi:MAG: BatD family protein [Muribaculaceae bacterium]|nr:BatD family protein [Muribaculaceae bacterium]
MNKKLSLFIICLIAAIGTAFAGSVRIYETAPRGKQGISVGDRFYISIEVNDIDGKPELPSNVGGAKVIYFDHTGQMSSMSNVNGHVTQSTQNTWTVTLRATSEGTFKFGPVSVGGVKSNQISYTIGKASAQAQTPGNVTAAPGSSQDDPDKPKFIGKGDGNLFMKASITESTVYEQQALVYTVKLYTTYDAIKFIGATAAPKFDGFVVEESKAISNSLDYETYNGKTYATAVIARYIIFPQMTGQLKVIGNTYTVSVDQREYYHDPFWGNMAVSKPLQLNVTPNDLTVNVKPLPSPKPADFSGGVGQFTIASQLKSSDFKTNQAGSIEYIITGTGNIKYVQMPDLATIFPSEIEVYTPKTEVKDNVGSSNVSGSSTFDYSFMPLEEGEFKIPAIKLVYFNPSTGKYETSVSKEYTIQVGKGKASSKSQTNSRLKFEPKLEVVKAKDLKKEYVPIIYRFPYWLFFILPSIALIVSMILYQRYMKLHADMAAFNSRRANKLAAKRLRKAATAMKKGNSELFYDEMLIAVWGYLGDKLKMPTSELMRDNIKNVLTEKEIPQTAIDAVVELLDNCEFAKYAPAAATSGMKDTYDTAVQVINNLEKSFKNSKSNK